MNGFDTTSRAQLGMNPADYDEHGPGYQSIKPLSPRGRMGRLRFSAWSTLAGVVMWVSSFALGFFMGAFDDFDGVPAHAESDAPVLLVLLPVLVCGVWFAILLVKRSHDMNWSGWTSLWTVIPLVVLLWYVLPGSPEENRYGAPAPPNNLMTVIGGLLVPLLMVLGFFFVVALPAWQSYMLLTRSTQVST